VYVIIFDRHPGENIDSHYKYGAFDVDNNEQQQQQQVSGGGGARNK
jgi:hypothetical protein